jgi:hypothetical protein
VAAVIGTNFNFTGNTAITNTAITATANTNTVTTAQLGTFSHTAIQSTVAWLADTGSIVAIAVDAVGTELGRTIWTGPSLLTVADSVYTFTTPEQKNFKKNFRMVCFFSFSLLKKKKDFQIKQPLLLTGYNGPGNVCGHTLSQRNLGGNSRFRCSNNHYQSNLMDKLTTNNHRP